jgi:hypothetical protein
MKTSHIAGGPESLLSLGLCKEDEQSFRCVSDDDIISFLSKVSSSVIRYFVWLCEQSVARKHHVVYYSEMEQSVHCCLN